MTASSEIVFAPELNSETDEFRRVLVESGLGAWRPVDDRERLAAMLTGANLIVTARLRSAEMPLVGFARCLTDTAWACYVADLAVCASAHGAGVGAGLMEEVRRQVGDGVTVLLVSVPDAVGFYERIGMHPVQDAYWYRRSR
ncbi:GNAT family N-acetyltransferase [Acidisphaera sp. L21]|uniref:GNAT family N-acetyltransferase n=1 Tax=Acidisphaera sp. L21 TaxID=1641851 RepID=UPI00131DD416|nr:GNAT family N-acetyltransferase [Acidisphaera sp. L21]